MKIQIKTNHSNSLAKAFRDTLESTEGQVDYHKVTIIEELLQYMDKHGIARQELARRMGVVPSRITRLLNGTENLTIETLVRAGNAVGADLQQTFVPKGQKGHWVAYSPPSQTKTGCLEVNFQLQPQKFAPSPKPETNKTAQRDAEDAA